MSARPAPDDVSNVQQCDELRAQVGREIGRKVARISKDESLNAYQLRDLNDQINQLMRERRSWERRLKALGGPDFVQKHDERDEYRYYGLAASLPGVEDMKGTKRSKKQATLKQRNVDAYYYGFGTEDDENVLVQEQAFKRRVAEGGGGNEVEVYNALSSAWINLPSQEQVEKFIMERKRQQIQQRYLDE